MNIVPPHDSLTNFQEAYEFSADALGNQFYVDNKITELGLKTLFIGKKAHNDI